MQVLLGIAKLWPPSRLSLRAGAAFAPRTPGPPPRMRGAEPPRTRKARRAAPPARRPATVPDRRLRCSSPLSAAMKPSGAAGGNARGARRPPHSPDGRPREAARAAPRFSAPGGGSLFRQQFPSVAWPALAAATPRSPPWCGLLRPNAGLRCSREGDTADGKSGGYKVGVGPRCPHRRLETKALLKSVLPQA